MTDYFWKKTLAPVQLLSHDDLERGAVEMYAIAVAEDVDAVLVGGSALHYFGSPRLTADVDFAAHGAIVAESTGTLSFGGEKLKSPSGVPVDWIVRDDDWRDFYEAAIDDPQPDRNNPAPVPVARPEFILVMKMLADRGKDRADIEWLIANEVVDLKRTRAIVRRYLGAYALKDIDAIVREVAWKKEKGEL